jgi:DNA-binding protein H-NS
MEEKRKLEQRLNQLRARIVHAAPPRPERHPKFRNPDAPHQTWSGRGKQPHWIRDLLQKGKQLVDLRISEQKIAVGCKDRMSL